MDLINALRNESLFDSKKLEFCQATFHLYFKRTQALVSELIFIYTLIRVILRLLIKREKNLKQVPVQKKPKIQPYFEHLNDLGLRPGTKQKRK